MIPAAALAHWLSDRDAQERSCDLVDASARDFRLHPLMVQLERELTELSDRSPEALIAVARRFMDRTGDLDAIMRDLIATSRTDPFFVPPLHPRSGEVQNSLLLYHHQDLSISLSVTDVDMLATKKTERRGPASINFTGFVTLLRFLKAGSATMAFWEAPPIADAFAAGQAGCCRLVGRRTIADGEDILVDGRFQSFVIEHAASDILILQAEARTGCAPVSAEYDSDSLAFIGATSTDEASSRQQMMVSLLRALDREDAFPIFEALLDSPLFYTRWHVMREMLAMDAEAALPSLRQMAAEDPHPDVRAAARQSLKIFFEDEQECPA